MTNFYIIEESFSTLSLSHFNFQQGLKFFSNSANFGLESFRVINNF